MRLESERLWPRVWLLAGPLADVLPRVQAGMNSRAFGGLLLNAQERRIRHFHRVLESYVYEPERG